MNEIAFTIRPSEETNDHEVRIIVDGRDIIEQIDREMLGIDPPEFFEYSTLLGSGELTIARCGCGVIGCGDATVNVMRDKTTVTWDHFNPQTGGVDSLTFSRSQYDSAVADAMNNHDWETTERTAERLIGDIDFSHLQEHGLAFSWASGRIDAQSISISLNLNSQYQVLVHLPWNHADAESAVKVTIAELAKPPAKWSNVFYYPQQDNRKRPPCAGPGWRRG